MLDRYFVMVGLIPSLGSALMPDNKVKSELVSKMYKIDQKTLSYDSPFLIDSISQKRIKLGTHEHLVLLTLCEQPGKVLDKETLIEKAWPGKFVTDSSLTQAIRNIRTYLNDDGKSQKHIKTIAKKGYLIEDRFVSLIQSLDNYPTQKLQEKPKKKHLLKIFLLVISIITQLTFIIISVSKLYPLIAWEKNESIYPNLSYHQDYIYIFSEDLEYSEKVGIELLQSLSAKGIVPERLYIMINKETVSYSFIGKNRKSKNRVLFVDNMENYKKFCEYIISEIEN